MQTSHIFHILGLVMWIGGLLALASAFKHFEADPTAKQSIAYKSFVKKFWIVSVMPGVILSLTSGIYQIITMGVSHYMKQGWFHGKLTLLIALFVITCFFWSDVKNVSLGKNVSIKRYRAFHGIIGAILLLILFLTYLGRGYA